MRASIRFVLLVLLAVSAAACAHRVPGPLDQFPSPLIESTREHGRVAERDLAGRTFTIDANLPKEATVYVPTKAAGASAADLVVFFHGPAFLVAQAVDPLPRPTIAVALSLGSGSSRYERPFQVPGAFAGLVDAAERATGVRAKRIFLASFSAGYGAVRAILRSDADRIDGILLLDSLHTGYLPDRKTLAEGGAIEMVKLEGFLRYAERARRGEVRMIVTHSEVFPGTYASTTECTDAILEAMSLRPTPVLEWGPNGMQQISEVRVGRFLVLGFAGNTGLDHGDHLHALPALLPRLVE